MVKMEIYIHIGLEKTGSTFLQRNVFPNLKDVNYVSQWTSSNREKLLLSPVYDDKINLFSDEIFSLHDSQETHRCSRVEIANRLHKIFPYANIILVLRDKEDWMRSLHRQYTTNTPNVSFNKWYDTVFVQDDLDYDGYVNHLKSLFNDVFILQYETLKNNPDEFVKQICNYIGVPVPVYKNEFVNKSGTIDEYNKTHAKINNLKGSLLFKTIIMVKDYVQKHIFYFTK